MGDHVLGVIQAVADTDYSANHLGLKHLRNRNPCDCDWCQADDVDGSPLKYSNFREGALWQVSVFTMEQWKNNVTPHPLWEAHVLIGITIFCICLDILHVMDLGINMYFLGSVVWTLVHDSNLPGPFEARAEHVWNLFHQAQLSCGVPRQSLLAREDWFNTFGRQTGPNPTDFPELSAKAAKMHHAVRPMLLVCQQVQAAQGLDRDEDNHRATALQSLTEFYKVLREAGHTLNDAQLVRAIDAADKFLLHQNALSMIYWRRKRKLFNITFKSHLFWHLSRMCRWFNPQHGWAFRDESFVGRVAKVMTSVVKGGGAMQLGTTLAAKWRHLQWFRMRRREGAVFA